MRAKIQRRTFLIITHSIHGLLPILNVLVSAPVVRLASFELWGEFVNVLIIVQIGTHVITWGNKDYLLREFSHNPSQIATMWQTSLITRFALFALFCAVIPLVGLPIYRILLIVVWIFGMVMEQAYDVLILYRRDFVFPTLVELGSLGVLALMVAHIGERLNLNILIALFALTTLARAILLSLRFRQLIVGRAADRVPVVGRFDARYLGLAFPFFLLGFSGMLASRVDLFCVSYFLPRSRVGQYQVFINLMIYLQMLAYFILAPFIKSIYRLGYSAIWKLASNLFGFGILILAPALALVNLVLNELYRFEISPMFLVVGGLFVLPVFLYAPIIYALYKANEQSKVIKTSFLGTGVNLAVNLSLLPPAGMIGAVIAGAAAQWTMLIIYLMQARALGATQAMAVSDLS